VSEFDDERLQGAMRAYLRAVDALHGAAGDYDERSMLDTADTKRLAELVLRSRLTEAGWVLQGSATRATAEAEPGGAEASSARPVNGESV
jgi:hypothetical protein